MKPGRIVEIEAEALKLDPPERARLARKLLESLEALSDAENERLWAERGERRDPRLGRQASPERG
jgi:hypothetical protein